MDIEKLSKELGELSEDEEQNMDRMKEIAKTLTQYFLDQGNGGKSKEKS